MAMRTRHVFITLIFGFLFPPTADAEERARPPKWTDEVQNTFFDDARTTLEGPRHNYADASTQTRPLQRAGSEDNSTFPWSHLISPTTLETEVKRCSTSLDAAVTTPSAFKSVGYKSARRDFSELAVLFAVIAQYDGDVRWKDVAAGTRDQFARAGFNAKVGTDATYREAVDRKQDLGALVRGERPTTPNATATFDDWTQIAARPQLMQRLETAHDERVTKWLTDAAAFRRNRENLRHEAEIVAVLAEVIHREAYEYWDDETFAEYAAELRNAATDTAKAAEADNFDQARDAAVRATGACTNCHAGYRGYMATHLRSQSRHEAGLGGIDSLQCRRERFAMWGAFQCDVA
jgi:hypothetical protein